MDIPNPKPARTVHAYREPRGSDPPKPVVEVKGIVPPVRSSPPKSVVATKGAVSSGRGFPSKSVVAVKGVVPPVRGSPPKSVVATKGAVPLGRSSPKSAAKVLSREGSVKLVAAGEAHVDGGLLKRAIQIRAAIPLGENGVKASLGIKPPGRNFPTPAEPKIGTETRTILTDGKFTDSKLADTSKAFDMDRKSADGKPIDGKFVRGKPAEEKPADEKVKGAGGIDGGAGLPVRSSPPPKLTTGTITLPKPILSPVSVHPQDLHTLAVKDLRKKFGRKEVVRGVNFSMHNGEVAGLLGPNGAGKTTIFYMIVGFYHPSAGKVTMDDVDITSKPMYLRARQGIAYLPQEASIFRKLTVEQNIWAILESRRDIKKKEKKQRLESLLDEFGIGRIRSQFGFTLSGGERRRTEIARALATEPKFLLLDEPFAGIDPIAVYEIKQIIRKLAEKGIGILITDHNVRDTLEITTEAFIIANGTIVARGDRDVILANEMVREVYLGSEFKM
jgi:lipopolysaccharide export system ATP-binding protein